MGSVYMAIGILWFVGTSELHHGMGLSDICLVYMTQLN